MDGPHTTTGTIEADEDLLTYTVSDEEIEAAAGIVRSRLQSGGTFVGTWVGDPYF